MLSTTETQPEPAPADAANPAPGGPLRRLRGKGDAVVATVGLALAAALLAAVSTMTYLNADEQASTAERTEAARGRSLATAMGPGLEAMLAADDVSAARLFVGDAASTPSLVRCRVVLPDGQVVASTEPIKGRPVKLPETWSEKAQLSVPPAAAGTVVVTRPLAVAGRGTAFLELAVAVPPRDARAATVSAVGAAGAAAMAAGLFVYRRLRRNAGAVAAVREALMSIAAGRSAVQPVNPDLGPEAVAWNALMADREQSRKEMLGERARDAVGRRRQGRGDLDAACDAMSQGLVLVDEAGRVKYANGAAAALLRVDREKLAGADVGASVTFEKVVSAVREVAGGVVRRRVVIDVEQIDPKAPPAKPGDKSGVGVLRFSVRPVRREDSAAAMMIIEDITQQKAAEEARHAFVAQATHELRTPLTNIRLYVETAIEDGEDDAALRSNCLNVINSETRRLERIVGEMLSVAEIEAGSFKLNRDDVRLDALFEELRNDYQQQAADKKLTLSLQLPPKLPVIVGDRDKVAIAMHNLVGNALKYTPSGGAVTVRVDADDKALNVAVVDTGIGISPQDCERIFERFYRASDDRVAKITGTGLGLTLAREVARLHGGDVTVESQLNRGSTFTLSLPLKAAA